MRFPGLPRLPVSRRRHDELAELVCAYNRIASEDLAEYKRRARKAEARVVEIEQAIREFRSHEQAANNPERILRAARDLYAVLDGHDHQERGDEPVTHQDGRRYRLVKDGERSFRAVEDDARHPRTGRWSRGERARDWLTGGSFKGVRRER